MTRCGLGLHAASIRGRARADAGPLLLSALVVAVVSVLAGAVPVLLRSTADEAVRQAVRSAADQADVRVEARWEADDGFNGGRMRNPQLGAELFDLANRSLTELGPLRDVLQPPVGFSAAPTLKVTDGSVLRTFQLDYLSNASGPAVTWIAGSAPAATPKQADVEVPWNGPPWPVQAGLSESGAAALGVKPGDRLRVADDKGNPKDVRISGVFRPRDPADPAWRLAPWLLNPTSGSDGTGTTRFGGLLSDESLPDARLAFGRDDMTRTVRFSPDPDVLTWDSAQRIAATVVALKASSGSSANRGTAAHWQTQLDFVLREVQDQIEAATAQASVLLTAVSVVAVLILLLAAELLVARRAPALTVARQRGASLVGLGGELLLESVLVAALSAGIGGLVARLFVPSVAGAWLLPVVLAAVLAGPAFGLVTADRATRDRRVPANRGARRRARRTAALRRLTLEAAVLAAAAIAVVVLHQRGVLPSAGGTVLLPAAAPTLGVLVGGLLLLRALPLVTGLVLRRALRSSRPLAVFGAARAASVSTRALPVLAVAGAAALAAFALTLSTTAGTGLTDGAWRAVGADARVDVARDAAGSTPELAARIAAAPGVRHVATGAVTDNAPFIVGDAERPARLVVVDPASFRQLLADTPLPQLPSLPAPAGAGSAVPALVRSAAGNLPIGSTLRLPQDGAPAIPFTAVGGAPAIDGAEEVVLVDAAAMTAAGVSVPPNTIWITGPGAAQAAHANAATVTIRADLERTRRHAPLVTGLLQLAWASAGTLLALGLLGFALSAATGAQDRWQILSRLRTLGLRPREARQVAAAELLPLALLAAVAGPLLGVVLAQLTLAPLGLHLLTAQTEDPSLVLPWLGLTLVAAAFPVMVAVLVPAEAAVRRRRRLSEILRVGGA
ncbi:putative ABC transport system permease protein [Actinoplanes octamycinicus]|uniref:Putative ABC transport system permease protein n=1 Tax=Actinoplanes octamycinicus TaxID=135948 RepID=A0A7W7M8Z8_9ACTN|nr:FtsX-like permease family protein [Actinoplanes octamycinicus]MBB4741301.1 putative ABC transport system permease protein [Actinoplanes octamycinicus]GIE62898.1 membrane protein [Actinoplanes octamycinicus]